MRIHTPQRLLLPVLILLLLAVAAACGSAATEPAVSESTPPAEATKAPVQVEVAAVTETPAAPATVAVPSAQDTAAPPPTFTPPATFTPAPTPSPTSRPLVVPTRIFVGTGSLSEGVPTPPTPIPSPVPTFVVPPETVNILLLGDDTGSTVGEDGRTDTMIIVSVDGKTKTASMISLPRDLYVYLPMYSMNRLNTAMTLGGVELLEQAILYNFGIPINYYARVNFDGFKSIVDQLGGVEVAVSCQLRDWRLKSPELNINEVDNWEMYTLEPGLYLMDGDLALWYVRSRLTTTDYDRGRRQQQLLRAMLDQGVNLGLVAKAPELWSTFNEVVDTDLDIGRILRLAADATDVANNGVQSLYLAGKMQAWTVPTNSAAVQLPIWEGPGMMQETFQKLFVPPALNKVTTAPITVEVINATGKPFMGTLAADNLAWYGFVPVVGNTPSKTEPTTMATYYGGNFKGSFNWLLSWVVGKKEGATQLVSDPNANYNYRVVLGEDYDPCRPAFYAPTGSSSGN